MSMEEPFDTLAEADDDTELDIGAIPNPGLEESPVIPLGFDGKFVVFGMPEGEIRVEMASKIGSMLRADIYACAAGQAFLVYWRDRSNKFQRDLATVWFVRACRDAGKWDSRRVMRSLGVWPGEPGEAVLHRGSEILRFAPDGSVKALTVSEALRIRTGPLYKLQPPAPRPDLDAPATMDDGAWLRGHMDAWRFKAIGDELTGADLVTGFVGMALLGAVAPFRGHLLLNALPGSGKTTFLVFVHALLSSLCGDIINSFTDAGFREEISGMARPVLVDEAESSSGEMGPGPVEQVLNYLRLMATGAGANRRMADTGAGKSAQTAVGSVLMAAAMPPKLDSAMASRVAEVQLLPFGDDPNVVESAAPPRPRLTDDQLAAAAAKARTLAPRLLARALKGANRYREDLAAMKAALIDTGEDARTADLVASLAAGRRLILHDAPLTLAGAKAEAEVWRALLKAREDVDTVHSIGADAFAHLMSSDAGMQRSGQRVTVGELIEETMPPDRRNHSDTLKHLGLRVFDGFGPDGREGPWLLVCNNHPAVERMFHRTKWSDYRKALAYMDAMGPEFATWPSKPLHFGMGVKQRSLAIPLTPWIEKGTASRSTERSGDRSGASQ